MPPAFQDSGPVYVALDAEPFRARFLEPFAAGFPRALWEEHLARVRAGGEQLLLEPEAYQGEVQAEARAEVLIKACVLECGRESWSARQSELMASVSDDAPLEVQGEARLACQELLGTIGLTIGGDASSPDDPPWSRGHEWSRFQGFTSPARLAGLVPRLEAAGVLPAMTRAMAERDGREEDDFAGLGELLKQAAARGRWLLAWEWVS